MSLPKPFYSNTNRIKAFVLGCDPTAFLKAERVKPVGERCPIEFETVFDIGRDERYLAGILANLNKIGIGKDDIYVQNLVTAYQQEESSKNKNWIKIAEECIASRVAEFDNVDSSRKIPVMLTSELLYKALLNDGEKRVPAKNFYNFQEELPIPAKSNKLRRPLLPLYRHRAYSLDKHKDFADKIRTILAH